MSDLLILPDKPKRPSGILERTPVPAPKSVFAINDGNVNNPDSKKEAEILNRTTTVRVTMGTKVKIDSLVMAGAAPNANELIDNLVEDYFENILSDGEKEDYKAANRMFARQTYEKYSK